MKIKFLLPVFLLALFASSGVKLYADIDPANNNPMPKSIAVDIADLLVLEDPAVAPTDNKHFAVRAPLYNSLLNLIGTKKAAFKILYTDKIAPYITYTQDEQGDYHYAVVSGQEETLLGYSKCLSATKFRDVLCKDQSNNYTVDAQVDSNSDSYVWICLNATNTSAASDRPASGYHYYQWMDAAGDYYDFYTTQYDNGSHTFDNSLGGEIWVGIKNDSKPTHDWTVTGNNKDGLTTYSDGGAAVTLPASAK